MHAYAPNVETGPPSGFLCDKQQCFTRDVLIQQGLKRFDIKRHPGAVICLRKLTCRKISDDVTKRSKSSVNHGSVSGLIRCIPHIAMSRTLLGYSRATASSDYIRDLTNDRRVRDAARWSSATPSPGRGPSVASRKERPVKGAARRTESVTLVSSVNAYKPAPIQLAQFENNKVCNDLVPTLLAFIFRSTSILSATCLYN
jgi:hypothetical protein